MNWENYIKSKWKTLEEMEDSAYEDIIHYCDECNCETEWNIIDDYEELQEKYNKMEEEYFNRKKLEVDNIQDFEKRNDNLHDLLVDTNMEIELECSECKTMLKEIDVNPIWG